MRRSFLVNEKKYTASRGTTKPVIPSGFLLLFPLGPDIPGQLCEIFHKAPFLRHMLTKQDQRRRGVLEELHPYLQQVEDVIRSEANAFDPAVEGYISCLLETGGKRIRPTLALLGGGAVSGTPSDKQIRLGLVVELIHIATLVHDDIMDGAELRRQMPTAVARWGSGLSVLLGDALFAHAMQLASEFNDTHVSRKVAQAAKEVCSGEILQTQRRFDLNLNVTDYFKIIQMKTAALFSVSTELGAYFAGGDSAAQESLWTYGNKLGIAYQIYDDSLDLIGSEEKVGKTLGTDLAKGKLTLPVIYLMERATQSQKSKLNKLIINREPLDVSILAGIADYEGAIEKALGTSKRLLNEGLAAVKELPDNRYRDGLEELVEYVIDLVNSCRK